MVSHLASLVKKFEPIIKGLVLLGGVGFGVLGLGVAVGSILGNGLNNILIFIISKNFNLFIVFLSIGSVNGWLKTRSENI